MTEDTSSLILYIMLLAPHELVREIALRVRSLRLESGWTQRDFAARAGVSFATYQLFERTGQISFERLYRIAIALHRRDEFEELFKPRPIKDIDELIPKPVRKRGKRTKKP